MKLQLMKAGQQRLADALTNNQPIKIGYYRIGTEAAFAPGDGGVNVLGPLVYQGDSSNIQYFSASNDEANFFLELTHDAGAYTVGNVMLFLEDNTPLLWGSLDRANVKSTSALQNQQIGAQITLVCTFWFPKLREAINFSNLTHRVVRLPRIASDANLPEINHAPWDLYSVDVHSKFSAPVVAIKNLKDGRWWGIPQLVHEDDPNINGINGGIAGEGYGSRIDVFHLGGTYKGFSQASLMEGGNNWTAPTTGAVNVDAGGYR